MRRYPDVVRVVGLVALAGACTLSAACGGAVQPAAHASTACPAAWTAGWQKIATRIGASVYCPRWMPKPLDGRIGGAWNGSPSVDKQGGYLVNFIYFEPGGTEVHVNFHRWPGTRMPRCRDLNSNRILSCYSDPRGNVKANGIRATFYTVSRDADQWHLAYLWRHDGATYVVSEHVAPPYTYEQVKANVTRILRNLVLLQPEG
jgi:hypothetical protein